MIIYLIPQVAFQCTYSNSKRIDGPNYGLHQTMYRVAKVNLVMGISCNMHMIFYNYKIQSGFPMLYPCPPMHLPPPPPDPESELCIVFNYMAILFLDQFACIVRIAKLIALADYHAVQASLVWVE